MLALLTQTAINLVDTYLIGLLQEPERSHGQAMLSDSLTLLWAVGGFLSAISVGTQALVGRREGQSNPNAAGAILVNAIVVALLSSTIVALLAMPLIPTVFRLTSDNPDYVRIGTAYTQWRFTGLISMVVTAAYKSFYDGTGRTYVHFWAAVIMNVVNATLCWLLIFGHAGLPHMGAEGAGLAAAISSWVGLLAMVLFSLRSSDRIKYQPYRRGALSLTTMKTLARLSVPSGVATTVVMTGFILFIRIVHVFDNRMAATASPEPIYGAATTIIINVLSLTFFSCLAFGVSTATLVSQSLGARDAEAAERYAWSSVKLAVIAFSVLGATEIVFPEFWLRIFNDSPAVISVGSSSMRLMGATGPFIAAGMILTQALFGAGNPRFVMMVELSLHFGVLLPVACTVRHRCSTAGLLGVWSAAAVYAVLLTAIMTWKFRTGTWKSIVL